LKSAAHTAANKDFHMWFGSNNRKSTNRVRRRREYHKPVYTLHARAAGQRQERMHKVMAVALLLVAAGGVIWLLGRGVMSVRDALFVSNEHFTIREIEAVSTGQLTPGHIKEYSGIVEGANLFALDLKTVRERLEVVPTIREVSIQRVLPSRLVLRVDERIPLARVAQGGSGFFFSVDRDSHVLGLAGSKLRNLPVIRGFSDRGITPGSVIRDAGAADALNLISMLDADPVGEIVNVSSIDVSKADYLDVSLGNGVQVLMPRHTSRAKLSDLVMILRESGGRLSFIDLTLDRNIPAI
jgi:cell division protein FtsQ